MIITTGTIFKDIKLISVEQYEDDRGSLTKFMVSDCLEKEGVIFSIKEQFYSKSNLNVMRGMHFQAPPFDHKKQVTVISGSVLDVVLDIRTESPTYGQCESFILGKKNCPISVVIPSGFAHGFLSLGPGESTLLYSTSTVQNSEFERAIKWDSFGYDWGISQPVVSSRDNTAILFSNFVSPF